MPTKRYCSSCRKKLCNIKCPAKLCSSCCKQKTLDLCPLKSHKTTHPKEHLETVLLEPKDENQPTNETEFNLSDDLIDEIRRELSKTKQLPRHDDKSFAEFLICLFSKYDAEKNKSSFADCLHEITVGAVNVPAQPTANAALPPLPAHSNPPTTADLTAAAKYVAQLGRAKGVWDDDIKRAIHYSGKLINEYLVNSLNVTIANSVTTAVNNAFVAQAVPQAMAQAVAQAVPQAVAQAVAQSVPQAVAQAVPQAVAQAVAPLTAQITNLQNRTSNRRAFKAFRTNDVATPLLSLAKTVVGFGGGLPNTQNVVANPPVGPAPLAIGAIVPFPVALTSANFANLTHANLEYLSIAYNDTFGIVQADNILDRRNKLERWLS